MNTNEAPEKIYTDENGNKPLPKRHCDSDIEYTRTDAFIEKACEWLEKSITNNAECNRIISRNGAITMGMLIEDFKQYMKGE